jgi:hypothetical protein
MIEVIIEIMIRKARELKMEVLIAGCNPVFI